ncbi:MAG: hypothetical protein KAW12_23180, partial [Candidatus Aminicenantes bacterium]|nr:hypothetical protein [Candidatus Aminicenantes bacterium]
MNSEQTKEKNYILEQAWEHFALYDKNALSHQKSSHRMQFWILLLGGFAAFLAVLRSQLLEISLFALDSIPDKALRYAVVVLPIAVSGLLALYNRFKPA